MHVYLSTLQDKIYGPVQDEMYLVEAALRQLPRAEAPWLTSLLEHVLRGAGKLLRPALTLLAGRNGTYDTSLLIPMATATEVLHTATLVHDDLVDHSVVRRGLPTINAVWDDGTAILAGDYLFAASAELVASTNNVRVMRLFAQTLMAICRGELQEVFGAYNWRLGQAEYYERIAGKTASLISMATESGAILSDASEAEIQALKSYGYNIGLAFQVIDDILDFTGQAAELGKPVGGDLQQGVITLPAILVAERDGEDNPVRWACEARGAADKLQPAIEAARHPEILAAAYAAAQELADTARRALQPLADSPSKESLQSVADYVIQRRA